MRKFPLRSASLFCLVIWVLIWLLFLLIRISSFDIRNIPGIGPIMLAALVAVLLAPIAAMVLAVVALFRQPRLLLNWLALACAVSIFLGQGLLFFATRWL
jgi:hypothetical protein